MASTILLLGVGNPLAAAERPTELCELEVQITHSPYVVHFGQQIAPDGNSRFTCTLSTSGLSLSSDERLRAVEPLCRRFIADAMAAATRCKGVAFDASSGSLALQPRTGSDADGPFFQLVGTSRRRNP